MMDQLDHDLLQRLLHDARSPITDLAKTLKVSRATIQNRIAKLKHQGVISRFTVELGASDEDRLISAFTLVRLNASDNRLTVAALKKISSVFEVHSLSGSFDLVIELRAKSLATLDTVLDKIRELPDVRDTETSIRLNRVG